MKQSKDIMKGNHKFRTHKHTVCDSETKKFGNHCRTGLYVSGQREEHSPCVFPLYMHTWNNNSGPIKNIKIDDNIKHRTTKDRPN